MRVGRRGVLLGALGGVAAVGAGGVLVEEDVLPGRSRAYGLLGLASDRAGVPTTRGGPRVDGSFASRARGVEVGWTVAYPPGSATSARLPVVVALHAGHGTHETVFDGGLFMDRFLAAAVADGVPPFAIAAADGGRDLWQVRPGRTGAGAMVLDEFVPLLGERGLDTGRLGFLGWSMGGYGALLLGPQARPAPRAVVATSPALTGSGGDPAYDVYAAREAWRRIPLRVDVGRGDPFFHAVMDFEDGCHPRPAGRVTLGSHTHAYWRAAAPRQLPWLAARL